MGFNIRQAPCGRWSGNMDSARGVVSWDYDHRRAYHCLHKAFWMGDAVIPGFLSASQKSSTTAEYFQLDFPPCATQLMGSCVCRNCSTRFWFHPYSISLEAGIGNRKHGAFSGGGSFFVFIGSHVVGKLILCQITFCGVRVGEAAVPGPLEQENGNHINGIFLDAEEAAPSLSRGNDVVEDIMARKSHFPESLLASPPGGCGESLLFRKKTTQKSEGTRSSFLRFAYVNAQGKCNSIASIKAVLAAAWDREPETKVLVIAEADNKRWEGVMHLDFKYRGRVFVVQRKLLENGKAMKIIMEQFLEESLDVRWLARSAIINCRIRVAGERSLLLIGLIKINGSTAWMKSSLKLAA